MLGKIKRILIRLIILMIIVFSTDTAINSLPYTTIVVEAAVKTPSLSANKIILYTGYHSYTLKPGNISAGAMLTYKSGNSSIATVTSKGVIKPVKKGSTIITATVYQNGKSYYLKCNVTVKNPNIAIIQSSDYLNVGESFVFKAKTAGMDDNVLWSVSNSDIASISPEGKLSAVTGGSIAVYAKAGGVTSKCNVTVGTDTLGTFSTDITIYDTTKIWINSTDGFDDEILTVDSSNSGIVSYTWGEWSGSMIPLTIEPLTTGTDTLTITSSATKDRLTIHLTVVNKPKKKQLSSTDIYAKCVPCTVEISVTTDGGEVLGSGFFIGDGRIVTNYHVIEGATKINVTTSDNKEYEIKTILGFNVSLDIAVLAIDLDHKYMEMSRDVAGGEDVYALGSPLGLTGTMTKGMVSTASRVIDDVEYIQIDASISHGNSGGPLVNSYGEVIGINTMYIEGGQNLNFAINIKELQKINLNDPVSIEEYHKKYIDYWTDWFVANLIYEDPSRSQDPDICQTAESGYGVYGTIKASEYGDCYYLEVTQEGYLIGTAYSRSKDDLTNTYISVYTYSNTLIGTFIEDETKTYQYFSQYLQPGKYMIMVYLPNGYSGTDIDYVFTLQYN